MALIWTARSVAAPAGFQVSTETTFPDTGRVTDPVSCSSVSVARISSRGERALKRLGNATFQWLVPSPVTTPLVITEWAARVLTTEMSRSMANWSKRRLAGSHASRYRARFRSDRPRTNRSRGPAAPVSYTHLRAHETDSYLVCRL